MKEINDKLDVDNKPPVDEKMQDILSPGYEVEFDPQEAEMVGAFSEDALSEKDALDSSIDVNADQ